MGIIKYTGEQHDILDHVQSTDGILLVSAGAGSGKSFLAEQIARVLKPTKALYTAFNKAIVEEGVKRFTGIDVECKTFHALAYKHVKPKKKIEDFTYSCITEKIAYAKKALIIKAVSDFFVSSSVDMYEFMNETFEEHNDKTKLVELCTFYIDQMIEGKLNPTFNYLLKYFHLMLVEGTVKCEYDLVIVDEINDTTAVALEIFKLIKAPKKLGLGETNQAIYQFLNLVNGFEKLKDEPCLNLTRSFRCSLAIAEAVEGFMKKDVSKDFTFVGTDEPVENGKSLFCTMTNAFVIEAIQARLSENKGFTLLRKPADIFACPLALITAVSGRVPYQKKYKFLSEEYEHYADQRDKGQSFFSYLLDHVEDREIQNAVRMLMNFNRKGIDLFEVYRRAKNANKDLSYTIATVFTSKGLEFEKVTIADDLNANIKKIRDNGGIKNEEDLVSYRCYYVACSRCSKNLYNATML